ncbi:hypothetical protein [Magnetovibrio sp.]|uniref:hypothetical protein n=1 Tax=Magnetovibrio sp. TaxID=2024836 RepID=UPI002F9405BA
MASRASFAYAQTRMQAHHGRRPTKSTWQYLNSSKSLGHYLDSARQTGLKRWVSHLTATSSVHAIEDSLRREWRSYVAVISAWIPREWRPALQWTGGLVDVPMTAHLARGLAVPDWAGAERPKTVLAQKDDAEWLAQPAPMAVWLEQFHTLLPGNAATRADGAALENVIAILQRDHGADKPANTLEGVEIRYQLISRMEQLFRRHAQQPAAVFAFLAMVAMDLEHLRAHLVHRSLFPETLDNR